ncbi:hypothetical protein [Leptolyngbya sp. KIOST-1]|uniref:hypothetical protein n=1 Tax=Leptolyngbya sp. KIOST-1 TaxID=1229172 RepID=UPI0005675934|nr:hypothetical protein [Leptolyngbya sp. KIOST-1]
MSQDGQTHSDRVKFIYNAQFPAATAVVLNYLLNNPHFTGRQGRQQGMDAMMAFYRPLAEEFHGELSVSEIQEMARHCVERLAKQIADLCDRYHITNPTANSPTAPAGDFSRLEAVLEQCLSRIADALQSGAPIPRATAAPNLEQGVDMDGSELGDLAQVLSSTGPSSSN